MMNRLRSFGRAIVSHVARRFRLHSSEDESLDDESWMREADSGEVVSRITAYTFGAWYRAISLVSSCVAKTSLDLWQLEKGRWIPAADHPAYALLCGHGTPNTDTLKYHFVQTLTAHAMGHGGGFAAIMRDALGRPAELLQLRPDRTWPIRENGRLMFVTSIGGDFAAAGAETRKLLAENVLHIHGLGWDGLTGYSVLELAGRAIGSAIAKERFGARFFQNSATPGVVIKTPRKLSDHAMKHLKESWQTLRTGIEQSHKPIILEDEAEAVAFTHSAADSQLLDAVQWDPVVVSNFTGVPPFLLGVKGYNSNSTLETQSQNLLDFTIDPWFVPWEQECNNKLLREAEKAAGSHHFEFARKDLIRVDSEKRASIYRAGLGGHPWLKVSEAREDEGLDQVPDTDFIPKPLNMAGADPDAGTGDGGSENLQAQIDELKSLVQSQQQASQRMRRTTSQEQDTPRADAQRRAVQQLWADTAGRMARRLSTARQRNAALDETALLSEHGETLRTALAPLLVLRGTERIKVDELTRELCRGIADNRTPEDVAAGIVNRICGDD